MNLEIQGIKNRMLLKKGLQKIKNNNMDGDTPDRCTKITKKENKVNLVRFGKITTSIVFLNSMKKNSLCLIKEKKCVFNRYSKMFNFFEN